MNPTYVRSSYMPIRQTKTDFFGVTEIIGSECLVCGMGIPFGREPDNFSFPLKVSFIPLLAAFTHKLMADSTISSDLRYSRSQTLFVGGNEVWNNEYCQLNAVWSDHNFQLTFYNYIGENDKKPQTSIMHLVKNHWNLSLKQIENVPKWINLMLVQLKRL